MSYWIYCVMLNGFCAIFEIICSPHLSRCYLHPCVPASDCSVPPERVSVSSSQCPAVASSFNPRSTVMGPFGRGCDCRLDHPAEFSLPAAHWEGEIHHSYLWKPNYIIFWKEYDRYYTDSFVSEQVSEGLVLRDGSRLKYPINGNIDCLCFCLKCYRNNANDGWFKYFNCCLNFSCLWHELNWIAFDPLSLVLPPMIYKVKFKFHLSVISNFPLYLDCASVIA